MARLIPRCPSMMVIQEVWGVAHAPQDARAAVDNRAAQFEQLGGKGQ